MKSFLHVRAVLVLATALSASAIAAPAAHAYTALGPAQIVGKVNAFRTAHGFPGIVRHDATLSAGCRAHNRWMQRNQRLQHPEIPGTPLYSAAGNQAGMTSILAKGPSWATGNPWLNAPLHLADLLMPGMTSTGASEEFGHNCLTTHTAANLNPVPPAADTIWTYPRAGGTQPYAQVVAEAPAPPQTFGADPIPDGQATGPNLITFFGGPVNLQRRMPVLTAATLTGPDGAAVATKLLNEETLYLLPPGAGLVIPRAPLKPSTTYTWTVTYSLEATEFEPAFSYTSEPRTFTTTTRKLCGTGVGGWYHAGSCPVGIVSAFAPRSLRRATVLRSGVRIVVRTDEPGYVGAVASAGRTMTAFGSARIGATRRGVLVARVNPTWLRAVLARRSSVVLAMRVSGTGLPIRVVRVTITR